MIRNVISSSVLCSLLLPMLGTNNLCGAVHFFLYPCDALTQSSCVCIAYAVLVIVSRFPRI